MAASVMGNRHAEVHGDEARGPQHAGHQPEAVPSYGPRSVLPSKLEPHKPYLEDRLKAGVWNAQGLLLPTEVLRRVVK